MFRTTGVLYCHSGLVVKVAAMTNVQACYGEHPTVERPSNDKYAFLCVFHTFKRKKLSSTPSLSLIHGQGVQGDGIGRILPTKTVTFPLIINISFMPCLGLFSLGGVYKPRGQNFG